TLSRMAAHHPAPPGGSTHLSLRAPAGSWSQAGGSRRSLGAWGLVTGSFTLASLSLGTAGATVLEAPACGCSRLPKTGPVGPTSADANRPGRLGCRPRRCREGGPPPPPSHRRPQVV